MIIHEPKCCKYVLYNDNAENQFLYRSVIHTMRRHRQSSSSCAYCNQRGVSWKIECDRGRFEKKKKVDSSKCFFFLHVCVCAYVSMYACNSDRINYIIYRYDAVSQFG